MRRDPHHHRSPPRWRFSPPYMSTPPCTQYDFEPLRADFSTDAPPTTSCGHATPRPNPWGWRSSIPPGTASGMTGGAMADATGSRPVFPILGVFRLKGQPKRDGSIIVRSCGACQLPVYPLNASSRTGLVSTKTPRIRLVVSGGLEPCRRSRPVRDATPTIAPTIFCSDRLAADAGPGRRRSQLPQIRPDALEAPDFVGIGEKPARQDGQRGRRNARQDGQRGRRNGGGRSGYRASWHDRGPGGRHDDGARSR